MVFRVGVILSSIATGVILARSLGPEGRGGWALLLLNIVLLTLICNLGTPESSIYFIGSKKKKKEEILFSLLTFSLGMVVLVFTLNFLLFSLGANFLFQSFPREFFWYSMLAILPQAVNTQMRHFLLGIKSVVRYNILNMLETVLLLMLIIILTSSDMLTLENVLRSYVLVNLINLLAHIIMVKKYLVWSAFFSSVKGAVIKENVRNGVAYFFTGMGGFWSQRLNILLIEIYTNVHVVGLYTVALAFPNLIANIPNQVALILYPYVSGLDEKTNKKEFTSLVVKASLMLTLLIALPLLFFGDYLILLVYGDKFVGLQLPLTFLLFAMIFEGIGSLIFNYFAGIGKPIYGSYQFLVSIGFLLIFGIILIPSMGIVGAAISKMIAGVASASFLIYLFVKNGSLIGLMIPTRKDFNTAKIIFKRS